MLPKSQNIVKQEQLVQILEAQLTEAKSKLSKLILTEKKISEVVGQLEQLLQENTEYKPLVADRLNLAIAPNPAPTPVRIEIEIEQDRLDEFTELLQHLIKDLKFSGVCDTTTVGDFKAQRILGKYGLSEDGEIWVSDSLTEELSERYHILLSNVVRDFNSGFEINLDNADYIRSIASTQPTEPEIAEAKADLFPDYPKPPTPSSYTGQELVITQQQKYIEAEKEPISCLFDQDTLPAVEKTTEPNLDEIKALMLQKQNKRDLEAFKAEIGHDLAQKIWDSCNLPEKNAIKIIAAYTGKAGKQPAKQGDLFQYTDQVGHKHKARYIGFYLDGQPVKDNQRVILVNGETKPTVVAKTSLKAYAASSQKPLSKAEIAELAKFLEVPPHLGPAEAIASLNFSGLQKPALEAAPPKRKGGQAREL